MTLWVIWVLFLLEVSTQISDLDKHLRHTSMGHSQASLPSKDDSVMAKACRAHMGKV